MQADSSSVIDGDSEDDFDWEEVAVPLDGDDNISIPPQDLAAAAGPSASGSSTPAPNIEITIRTKPKVDEAAKKRSAELYAERVARLNCHKMHTILLLGNARIRNKWINDPLLHARLMSLTPMNLQNAFAMIHKSRVPEAAKRGRLFESAMTRLVAWWIEYFTVLPEGHIRSRTFEQVQAELARKNAKKADRKGKGRARDVEDDEDEDEGEVVRSEKSLMKHALRRSGSRDVSAQLFTALCRALGIPARLVVSLQSVPWQARAGQPKASAKKPKKENGKDPKGKGKQKATEEDEDMEMEEVDIPAGSKGAFPGSGARLDGNGVGTPTGSEKSSGKQKAPPVINLRKSRGTKLGSASVKKPKRERTPDPTTSAPVFWTEVFSKADARWLPVDPIRGLVNKRTVFDPTSTLNSPAGTRVENRMVYVVAFEEDGFGRDVTPRYAREYGAKVAKMQQGGKGKKEWWERVMKMVTRPYRLNRDDLEDEELHTNQLTEQMPSTMAGFKNHPLYVLARHLKRDEVIHPPVELGKFRGEPVYPRSSVLALKTAENWTRQGRRVRAGCQPMKWVKQHAVTVHKRRAVEMALAERGDRLAVAGEDANAGFAAEKDVMQGLYAENQTELYVPDPVINGKVPKNDFGNIDLYVPSMLPAGGAYIPHKGAAKIARQLGFDFAEAVTGFEFKKRRAFPLITGIVVAAENEDAVLEAYWAAEQEAEKKRRTKREEQVIKRWQRLIQGLRIRQRLQEQYADRSEPQSRTTKDESADAGVPTTEQEDQQPGGFLSTADDVVQPYTLPRNLHDVIPDPLPLATAPPSQNENSTVPAAEPSVGPTAHPSSGFTLETFDIEEDEAPPSAMVQTNGAAKAVVPKSMRELAESAEHAMPAEPDEVLVLPSLVPHTPEPGPRARTLRTAQTSARTSRSGTNTPARRATARAAPRRGRKRTRDDNGTDEDTDDEAEVEDSAPPAATPAKRARTVKAAEPVVKSDRVLRSRRGKSAAQVEEEREQEAAYRRAIAD